MKRILHLITLSLLALLPAPALFAGLIEQVTVDTTPLTGVTGYLAFDLVGGSPMQGNSATISAFTTTGTLGVATTSGDVTGTLVAPPVVLTATTQFFNEYLQPIVFGNGLTFELALTTNFATGATPDSFSFFLLDSAFAPFQTSDPTGANSLFAIDITDTPNADVFTSDFAAAQVTPASSAVPEPASVVLLALGFGFVAAKRARRSEG
jgi:hypothetical protein